MTATPNPSQVLSDGELYLRGARTLIASWEEYARAAQDAVMRRADGVAVAIFPSGPERDIYNNALLDRGLGPRARAEAIEAMESLYVHAGVDRFAAWAHETDAGLRADLERRGYGIDTSTLAMGMSLDEPSSASSSWAWPPMDCTSSTSTRSTTGCSSACSS